MQRSKLSKTYSKLLDLSYELAVLLAADRRGEPLHPRYKKDREALRQLMRSHVQLQKATRQHFQDLAARVPQLVDWLDYGQPSGPKETTPDSYWDAEAALLIPALSPAFSGGLR